MSDRYRPRGPKNQQRSGYQSRSSYVPQRRDNRERDSYIPSGPKRLAERDNYRPDNDQYQQQQQQQQQQENRPAQHRESSSNSTYSSSSSSSSFGVVNPPKGPKQSYVSGMKRPLPSGPASFRKRRDFISNTNRIAIPKGPRQGFKEIDGAGNGTGNGNGNGNGNRNRNERQSVIVKQKLSFEQIYCIKTTNTPNIYQRVSQVGEGTYGKVYKAQHKLTGEYVAMKKLRLESEKEGFPITAIREIKLLQSFDHANVVGLLEMMVEYNQIYMVFDYLDHDLTGLLTHPDLQLQECHRKFIFKQLMEGLNYLHKKRIIHRDIKGSNILLDNIGRLKIADFGLARTMKIVNANEKPDYTNRVITIWYRPPELLLGATDYGREVDVWGVGCLLIELYCKMAAFRGMDEVSQLCRIFNIMGTPTLQNWPEIDRLPWFEMLKPKINVKSKFSQKYSESMSPQAFKLAEQLLQLNPKLRPTAEEALNHEYFQQDPKPEPLYFLKDIQGEWHEFETKKRRRAERKRIKEEEDAQLAASKKSAAVADASVASATNSVKEIESVDAITYSEKLANGDDNKKSSEIEIDSKNIDNIGNNSEEQHNKTEEKSIDTKTT
ncbi:kinase subunit of RNA polymerase II carboxy-terminal domain kinase I, putative [Candida dubliniensis CD36]|uniref:Kinase subunit of RNA polymerase II carboxy-terminal domain kinase I, putative n=1 Tax=Candida dubliniensis (strain CD36 / ATCC MYA-646 / CBS 7987 / NCPF 3949 / NRRL Y-17841) TaxID=573826 RepID=B9WDJ5_CANDC|nr:kinase subunit of RNA polymerase II carboxy-terminal domain kinase I, putative [Candida dubliniensis CD36]CAX42751.1 kinase subunit of RNA polymerase II carboxy-terminal domain kinase I, putative [Candida dubliniensis CD36]